MLNLHVAHINILADKIDNKLLVIKIIECSKSLRGKVYYWAYQIAKGVAEIFSYDKSGVHNFKFKRSEIYNLEEQLSFF